MKCEKVSGLISEYLDGELQSAQALEFEAHTSTCETCSAEVASMRAMLGSLRSLSGMRSPVDCWAQVRARVAVVSQVRTPWWRVALRPAIAAPALAAAASIALFLAWPSGNMPMASDKAFAPEYRYYIAAHSQAQRHEAFADPDVAFVGAEMQKASLLQTASNDE